MAVPHNDSKFTLPQAAVVNSGVNFNKCLAISLGFHGSILLFLVLSMYFSAPLPVFENTNKNDVISAVVLGDTADSKILPKLSKEISKPKVEPKVDPKTQPMAKAVPDKDVIALKKKEDKKKLAKEKALEALKKPNLFAKDLLADIKNVKKIKQKQLQSKFQKTLVEQAEKSLRQQMLNEEIKLQGTQSRQAQGEVDKYKALILQSMSEHWIVPTQADKTLYCELMIHLAPGGMVLDVRVTKTSGDPSLDSSARAAVLKSSPLPVPTNPKEFAAFRQFVLKVKPENILVSDA